VTNQRRHSWRMLAAHTPSPVLPNLAPSRIALWPYRFLADRSAPNRFTAREALVSPCNAYRHQRGRPQSYAETLT
jgi:hypothetical protein